MKVYSVRSSKFRKYGRVLEQYDYEELFKTMEAVKMQNSGIDYVASVPELEKCEVASEMQNRGFGGIPIQIGYVCGKSHRLDCLEYHKSSEFNIAVDDVVLVVGKEEDIEKGSFNTKSCEAFLLPSGVGVELFATTLHYAPFNVNDKGYKMICVLPRGTNSDVPEIAIKCDEDKMCFGTNKWIMTHPDAAADNVGVYVGIEGVNFEFNMLEFWEVQS